MSFTKKAWLSQHLLKTRLQRLLNKRKITEAQYQSPLISLINFNNARMFKHNGSILTTSKYRRANGKPDTCYHNSSQRFPSSSSHICPFAQIFESTRSFMKEISRMLEQQFSISRFQTYQPVTDRTQIQSIPGIPMLITTLSSPGRAVSYCIRSLSNQIPLMNSATQTME